MSPVSASSQVVLLPLRAPLCSISGGDTMKRVRAERLNSHRGVCGPHSQPVLLSLNLHKRARCETASKVTRQKDITVALE